MRKTYIGPTAGCSRTLKAFYRDLCRHREECPPLRPAYEAIGDLLGHVSETHARLFGEPIHKTGVNHTAGNGARGLAPP